MARYTKAARYWRNAGVNDARRRINLTEDFINRKLSGYYKDAKAEMLGEIEDLREIRQGDGVITCRGETQD